MKRVFNSSSFLHLANSKKDPKKKGRKRKRIVDDDLDETKRPWNIAQLRPWVILSPRVGGHGTSLKMVVKETILAILLA